MDYSNASTVYVYVADRSSHKIRRVNMAEGTVDTVAGSGSSGCRDGLHMSARFYYPMDVVVLKPNPRDTDVYVADSYCQKVKKLEIRSTSRIVHTIAGTGVSGTVDGSAHNMTFLRPNSIAAWRSPRGDLVLYVVDYTADTIRAVNMTSQEVTTIAGVANSEGYRDGTGSIALFDKPYAVAVDASRANPMLYVTEIETDNHYLRSIDLSDNLVYTTGGIGTATQLRDGVGHWARFSTPRGIAIDSRYTRNIYLADYSNRAIRAIRGGTAAPTQTPVTVSPTSTLSPSAAPTGRGVPYSNYLATTGTVVPNMPDYPRWVAVGENVDTIYATGSGNKVYRIHVPSGNVTVAAGSGSAGGRDGLASNAYFNAPHGLSVDYSNASTVYVYVADRSSHKIRRVNMAEGTVDTVAGSGSSGYMDGLHMSARFRYPTDVAQLNLSPGYTDVYVADDDNEVIRVLEIRPLSRLVYTVAGSGASGSVDGRTNTSRFVNPNSIVAWERSPGNVFLYVVDSTADTIRAIDVANHNVTTIAGVYNVEGNRDGIGTAALFDNPWSVAIDTTRNMPLLYVTSTATDSHYIRAIDLEGFGVTTVAGIGTSAQRRDGLGHWARFNSPRGIAFDSRISRNIYVADYSNRAVRVVYGDVSATPTASPATLTPTATDAPSLAPTGRGFAANKVLAQVRTVASGLVSPLGVTVCDDLGLLYLTSKTGNRVYQVLLSNGSASVLAGTGSAGSTDGLLSNARFNAPRFAEADCSNASRPLVYVAGGSDHKIRRINMHQGTVDTVCGSGSSGLVDGIHMSARFNTPVDVAVRHAAPYTTDVFILDSGNARIRRLEIRRSSRIVYTFAGSGSTGSFRDGVGTSVQRFYNPYAMALMSTDSGGALYIADENRVRALNLTTGELTSITGGSASGNVHQDGPLSVALFTRLSDIALDTTRDAPMLYVAENFYSDTHYIRGIDLALGTSVTAAGIGTLAQLRDGVGHWARFNKPVSLAFSQATRGLYIVDDGNDAIRVLEGSTTASPTTTPTTTVPTLTRAPSSSPTARGIALWNGMSTVTTVASGWASPVQGVAASASEGLVYVSSDDHKIYTLNRSTGVFAALAGVGSSGDIDGLLSNARFSSPRGLDVDGAGSTSTFVFFADSANHKVRRIDLALGAVDTLAGSSSGCVDGMYRSARLTSPNDVAVLRLDDEDVDVYIANSGCNRVERLEIRNASRIVYRYAGTGTAGSIDGPSLTSRFKTPTSLALATMGPDSDPMLFVVDNAASTVRLVNTTSGLVETLGGSADDEGSADGSFASARFYNPYGIAVDRTRGANMVYVSQAADDVSFIRSLDLVSRQVRTVAGIGTEAQLRDGAGYEARFSEPLFLAFGTWNNRRALLAADTTNVAIRAIEMGTAGPTSSPVGSASPTQTVAPSAAPTIRKNAIMAPYALVRTASSLGDSPRGIDIGSSRDNMYLVGASRVYAFNFTSSVSVVLAGGASGAGRDGALSNARFKGLTSVDVDLSAGTMLYLTDYSDNRIRRADLGAATVDTIAGSGAFGCRDGYFLSAQLKNPWDVAVDRPNGRSTDVDVYISDTGCKSIRRLQIRNTSTLLYTLVGSSQVSEPRSLDLYTNAGGNKLLYFVDYGAYLVRSLDIASPGAVVTNVAGGPSSSGNIDGLNSAALFNRPVSISVDVSRSPPIIYVGCSGSRTVRSVDLGTGMTYLVGGDFTTSSALADGYSSKFDSPVSLVIDSFGKSRDLFIADQGNNRIRYIEYNIPSLAPTVTYNPTSQNPTTCGPTTVGPITRAPTTCGPTSASPATGAPTTCGPTTDTPTTASPATGAPTTLGPTTDTPTTGSPVTATPTGIPTTGVPTSAVPTSHPTTCGPTTANPTCHPTSGVPSRHPTTCGPTTLGPTTLAPTCNPTTCGPTTLAPTCNPTTLSPTANPTTCGPTTQGPTTQGPTTGGPTTCGPTTQGPTTLSPVTSAPTIPPLPTLAVSMPSPVYPADLTVFSVGITHPQASTSPRARGDLRWLLEWRNGTSAWVTVSLTSALGANTSRLTLPRGLLRPMRTYRARFSAYFPLLYGPHPNRRVYASRIFNTSASAVTAAIVGGGERDHVVSRALILDGSASRDPDLVSGAVESFSWNCTRTGVASPGCPGLAPGVNMSQPMLRVPPNSLSPGENYTFGLQYKVRYRDAGTWRSRSAWARVLVMTTAADLPTIELLATIRGAAARAHDGTILAPAGAALTLASGTLFNYTAGQTSLSYKWSIAPPLEDGLTMTRPSLNIAAALLRAGQVYTFRVLVRDATSGLSAAAARVVEVLAPPSIASIGVAPLSGVAFQTVFALNCSAQAATSAQPLAYSFALFPSGLALSEFAPESYLQTTLPAGSHNVVVTARDALGSVVRATGNSSLVVASARGSVISTVGVASDCIDPYVALEELRLILPDNITGATPMPSDDVCFRAAMLSGRAAGGERDVVIMALERAAPRVATLAKASVGCLTSLDFACVQEGVTGSDAVASLWRHMLDAYATTASIGTSLRGSAGARSQSTLQSLQILISLAEMPFDENRTNSVLDELDGIVVGDGFGSELAYTDVGGAATTVISRLVLRASEAARGVRGWANATNQTACVALERTLRSVRTMVEAAGGALAPGGAHVSFSADGGGLFEAYACSAYVDDEGHSSAPGGGGVRRPAMRWTELGGLSSGYQRPYAAISAFLWNFTRSGLDICRPSAGAPRTAMYDLSLSRLLDRNSTVPVLADGTNLTVRIELLPVSGVGAEGRTEYGATDGGLTCMWWDSASRSWNASGCEYAVLDAAGNASCTCDRVPGSLAVFFVDQGADTDGLVLLHGASWRLTYGLMSGAFAAVSCILVYLRGGIALGDPYARGRRAQLAVTALAAGVGVVMSLLLLLVAALEARLFAVSMVGCAAFAAAARSIAIWTTASRAVEDERGGKSDEEDEEQAEQGGGPRARLLCFVCCLGHRGYTSAVVIGTNVCICTVLLVAVAGASAGKDAAAVAFVIVGGILITSSLASLVGSTCCVVLDRTAPPPPAAVVRRRRSALAKFGKFTVCSLALHLVGAGAVLATGLGADESGVVIALFMFLIALLLLALAAKVWTTQNKRRSLGSSSVLSVDKGLGASQRSQQRSRRPRGSVEMSPVSGFNSQVFERSEIFGSVANMALASGGSEDSKALISPKRRLQGPHSGIASPARNPDSPESPRDDSWMLPAGGSGGVVVLARGDDDDDEDDDGDSLVFGAGPAGLGSSALGPAAAELNSSVLSPIGALGSSTFKNAALLGSSTLGSSALEMSGIVVAQVVDENDAAAEDAEVAAVAGSAHNVVPSEGSAMDGKDTKGTSRPSWFLAAVGVRQGCDYSLMPLRHVRRLAEVHLKDRGITWDKAWERLQRETGCRVVEIPHDDRKAESYLEKVGLAIRPAQDGSCTVQGLRYPPYAQTRTAPVSSGLDWSPLWAFTDLDAHASRAETYVSGLRPSIEQLDISGYKGSKNLEEARKYVAHFEDALSNISSDKSGDAPRIKDAAFDEKEMENLRKIVVLVDTANMFVNDGGSDEETRETSLLAAPPRRRESMTGSIRRI